METIWTLKKADKEIVDNLSYELEIPQAIARVLAYGAKEEPAAEGGEGEAAATETPAEDTTAEEPAAEA